MLVKIGKCHLTFSKRLGCHLISLKKFILNEFKLKILSCKL